MRTIDCFERAQFYEHSPAADEFYERRLGALFELRDAASSIEIHVQWPLHSQAPSESVHSDDEASCHSDDDTECGSKPDMPLMEPPLPINSCKEDHARPEGPPRLLLHKVFDPDELRKMEHVRSSVIPRYAKSDQGQHEGFKTTYPNMVCAYSFVTVLHRRQLLILSSSFIRQRHSYSRLLLTRDLFETLMSKFDIFPRFREFIILFGAKHAENEIGPPQMCFRRLAANRARSGRWEWAGFGSGIFNCWIAIADIVRMRLWATLR